MFPSLVPYSVARFGFGRASKVIDIPSVEIHDIETGPDKRTRRFKHLLKLNHVNHAVLFNDRKFHNHLPHLLGSAYLLGGSPEHLNDCYDDESSSLVHWQDSPDEIAHHDWRDHLGQKKYERAYLDFFEDQLVNHGYDWKTVVQEFLLDGKEPLINSMISGLGHPLIHLGYAYEVSSREVCMEALTLTAVCYSPLHKYFDDPTYSHMPTPYETTHPFQGLAYIAADSRFDNLFTSPGGDNFSRLLSEPALEQAVLSHWAALKYQDPTKTFKQTQLLATALLICSHGHSTTSSTYDFYLVHLLTTSHAIRILVPLIPSKHHISLLRQWWLLVVGFYISQLRPTVSLGRVRDYDLKGRGWEYVEKMALEGKHSTDAHYVKGLRAMKAAMETWGEEEGDVYLKAAVRFADEFGGWGGFTLQEEID